MKPKATKADAAIAVDEAQLRSLTTGEVLRVDGGRSLA